MQCAATELRKRSNKEAPEMGLVFCSFCVFSCLFVFFLIDKESCFKLNQSGKEDINEETEIEFKILKHFS